MKKLKMKATKSITFEEGCNKYLEYCQQRDLKQGTICFIYRQAESSLMQSSILITTSSTIVCLAFFISLQVAILFDAYFFYKKQSPFRDFVYKLTARLIAVL